MLNTILDRLQGKAAAGQRRSPKWRSVRNDHIERHPRCAVCDGRKKLEAHHVIPFHLAPDLELDPNNLLTLCEAKRFGINCHQLVGHLGNYRRWNPTVIADAGWWGSRLRG